MTPQGEYLQSRASEIVSLADRTSANIQSDQVISGDLTIGAGESIGMNCLMEILGGIIQDYPQVKLHLCSGDANDTEKKLARGVLDFAVLMGDRPLDNYHYLQLPETDQWGLILKKEDPLSQKEFILPEDLLGHPLILSEQALQVHRFQKWWGNLGPQMNIIGSTDLIFNASLLVAQSNAYLLSFNHLIDTRDSQLTFRPLKPSLSDPITVIWKKNIQQSQIAKLFLERLQASLSK